MQCESIVQRQSLKKIKEQRELISQIRAGNEIVDPDEPIAEEKEIAAVVEKAGKVLSKKTRSMISTAIESMGKSIIALNDLVENADKKEEQENVIELPEQDDEKEIEATFPLIDEGKLKDVIAAAFVDLLRDHPKVNANTVVKERVDLAKGKIF